MEKFLTQKLSWSQINGFPHSSFNWVALDGSQVLVHMPPDNTYTAQAHFGDVKRTLEQHKDLEENRTGMLLYGYGDGGGGPTAEMIEKLRRCRGLSDTVGLLPRVKTGPTVEDFWDTILDETNTGKDLNTWNGEMYLEYHRGTYTTHGDIKKGNRYTEILMHDIEWLATLASITNDEYQYPTDEIDKCWQDVCLNQFHDVLPGSGIEMVYDDANAVYKSVFERGYALVESALNALGVSKDKKANSQLVGLNTLPWNRSAVLEVEDKEVASSQSIGSDKKLVHVQGGRGILTPQETTNATATVSAKETEPGVFELKNGKLHVTIEGGALTSVYDKVNDREVLAQDKKGNQFVIFDDKPLSFPAWDTDLYSLGTRKELPPGDVQILSSGPLRASVQVDYKISDNSSMTTLISLDAVGENSSIVAFDCTVDWHETYKFLKVEFPVDVVSDSATYDTSYGSHKRATHFNTSWDVAKFEVCAHKWADLSDATYGVAVLNDCKYGYAIHGNVMRLSLLRSPKSPDANADMGVNKFKYAIFPHAGGINADVVKAGYAFNHPLQPCYAEYDAIVETEDVFGSVTLEGNPNLIIGAIKRHEDDKDVSKGFLPVRQDGNNIIVRVYDSLGGRAKGKLNCEWGIKSAHRVNILEDDLEELDVNDDGTSVDIEHKAFEIVTYRLELA